MWMSLQVKWNGFKSSGWRAPVRPRRRMASRASRWEYSTSRVPSSCWPVACCSEACFFSSNISTSSSSDANCASGTAAVAAGWSPWYVNGIFLSSCGFLTWLCTFLSFCSQIGAQLMCCIWSSICPSFVSSLLNCLAFHVIPLPPLPLFHTLIRHLSRKLCSSAESNFTLSRKLFKAVNKELPVLDPSSPLFRVCLLSCSMQLPTRQSGSVQASVLVLVNSAIWKFFLSSWNTKMLFCVYSFRDNWSVIPSSNTTKRLELSCFHLTQEQLHRCFPWILRLDTNKGLFLVCPMSQLVSLFSEVHHVCAGRVRSLICSN